MNTMKHPMKEFAEVDENTEIAGLFDADEGQRFDAVISRVERRHPAEGGMIFNERSQRGYYVINGQGKIHVDNETCEVEVSDFVFVPRETAHAVEGELRLLVVTSPPFDPEDEEVR